MTTARELARSCDAYVSALWRGESEEVLRFASWLRAHRALGPAEPASPPAPFSAVGGGAGIGWHLLGRTVYGYIPGVAHRCYRVPVDATPPPLAGARQRGPRDERSLARI